MYCNWDRIRKRDIDSEEVPFVPNLTKFNYVFNETHPEISNITGTEKSPNEPNSSLSQNNKRLLGDFTIYKVNKEFENF